MRFFLAERLSYDQLFRVSEPKRVARSFKVKGPPLEIESFRDATYNYFNFKSSPSTTGLRQKGYVKFFRPRHGGQKPLQHLDCLVDCTCPDFRYRWAWANKQRGSSRVGDQSLNQALNRAPRRTNPGSQPGLCKHILAAREYIYGLLSSFPSDEGDVPKKLDKLTRYATTRWINFSQQMAAAKERDARIQAAIQARNVGQVPYPDVEPVEPEVPEVPLAEPPRADEPPETPPSFAAGVQPPGARGRNLPPPGAPPRPAAPSKSIRRLRQQAPPTPLTKKAAVARQAGYPIPAEYEFRRRQGLGDSLTRTPVVNANGKTNMNNILTESLTFIREMEDEELDLRRNRQGGGGDEFGGGGGGGEDMPPGGVDMPGPEGAPDEFGGGGPEGGGDMPTDMGTGGPIDLDLPPSETGMSDASAGADTQGDTALSLLRDIRNSLVQLSSALVPEPDAGMGEMTGMEGGAIPGEGDGPPIPPGEGEDAGGGEGDIPVAEPEFEEGEGEGDEKEEGPAEEDDDDDED